MPEQVSRDTSTDKPREVYFPDQRSVHAQMSDVYRWAQREGMYDACEWMERTFFGAPIDGDAS